MAGDRVTLALASLLVLGAPLLLGAPAARADDAVDGVRVWLSAPACVGGAGVVSIGFENASNKQAVVSLVTNPGTQADPSGKRVTRALGHVRAGQAEFADYRLGANGTYWLKLTVNGKQGLQRQIDVNCSATNTQFGAKIAACYQVAFSNPGQTPAVVQFTGDNRKIVSRTARTANLPAKGSLTLEVSATAVHWVAFAGNQFLRGGLLSGDPKCSKPTPTPARTPSTGARPTSGTTTRPSEPGGGGLPRIPAGVWTILSGFGVMGMGGLVMLFGRR